MTNNASIPTRSLRQLVLDSLHFQETAPLPYTLPVEQEVAEQLDRHFQSQQWRNQIHDHLALVRLPTLSVNDKVTPKYLDCFGSLWRTDRRPYHLERPVLAEPDLSKYRWPIIEELWDEEALMIQIEAARKKGQLIVATTGFGIFERSWTMRGYENALTDMVLNPSFYHQLLDGILEILIGLVERLSALPVEGIMLSDDWGGQRGLIMGAKHWRRFIQPHAQQFFSAIHNAGKWTFQHCCGNIMEIIPEMIESGLDVLESLQPEAMNVYEIKRRFGRELCLWGGLGTQRLLPFGTPMEIHKEIAHLRSEMGRGGGYILAPAKPLMSEIPTENAVAVLEAFTGQ